MPSKFLSRSLFVRPRTLIAAVALGLATAVAIQGASAGGQGSLPRLPAAGAEAAPATVGSEAPLQRFVQLTDCNAPPSTTCVARVARVPANERWAIQFVSCTVDTAATATFRNFSIQIADAAVTKLLGFHFIAPTYQSDRLNNVAVNVASQPVVLTAEPGNVIFLVAMSIGGMGSPQCAVSGVKQKLG